MRYRVIALAPLILALAGCSVPPSKEYTYPAWNFAASFRAPPKVTDMPASASGPHAVLVESKAKEDVVAKSYDFYQKNQFFDVTGKVSRSKMTALLKVLKELGDVEGSIEVERFVLPGIALVD